MTCLESNYVHPLIGLKRYELPHDKTNKMACAPSEDSDQPGHPPSLIKVFACAQWVAKDPSFLHADGEDSDQTRRMPRLIWVFAGRTVTWLVLSCRGSYLCVTMFSKSPNRSKNSQQPIETNIELESIGIACFVMCVFLTFCSMISFWTYAGANQCLAPGFKLSFCFNNLKLNTLEIQTIPKSWRQHCNGPS